MIIVLLLSALPAAIPGPPAVDSPLAAHVTYIAPLWMSFLTASDAQVAAEVSTLRSRIGEGGGVKLGFATYVQVMMNDWHVDISSPSAIRAQLTDFESQVDLGIQRARANNIVFVINLLTAIRSAVDEAQSTSYDEDRRVMQWDEHNQVLAGWWTHSRYARRQYAVQRAYMQEVAKILAERVAKYPETLVAIAGDGEVELAGEWPDLCDYSPFALAEFRDWLRGEGLYGPGAVFEGEAYELAARYRGDASPGVDSNGDGHTLNGDFGTAFTSWQLRYFDWPLSDSVTADPNAIQSSVYGTVDFNPLPDAGGDHFDVPRSVHEADSWWEIWNRFRQTMVWHHNRDLAMWMTTATTSDGLRLTSDRWFSYQIPADYLFGSTPGTGNGGLVMSASPWWTANVAPYGGLGFTSFGIRLGASTYLRTLPGLVAGIPSCGSSDMTAPQCVGGTGGLAGTNWGLFEWHPVVPQAEADAPARYFQQRYARRRAAGAADSADTPELPGVTGPEAGHLPMDDVIDRDEMAILRQYRPRVLVPYAWGTVRKQILNTGFERALRQFTDTLKNGWAPSLQVDRATVALTALRGPQPVASTPDEQVLVSQPTGGTVDWTASADQPWLKLSGATGHGDGFLRVGVDVSRMATLAAGVYHAAVTVSAPGSIEGQRSVDVTVTLADASTAGPPIGLVDTPAQNATGVVGSIGVTGWVVDAVGVRSVRIYRNCLPFEPVMDCAVVNGVVAAYVGDATLVSGARPDIEAAYPTYPEANRAAWGYLLLTNMLPHIPLQQMFGGQGPLTLYALAENVNGQRRWLGRGFIAPPTLTDETPTSITMANDTIAKPFGAIDTPAQGEAVSNQLWNFGWALTPDLGTAADPGAVSIPSDGSTQWVYIDGVPVASLSAANLCRGTVAVPLLAGAFCDDDIASIFGHVYPQPTYSRRSDNPTRYRNLDAGHGAIGAYFLDTATLANGLHTIAWGVTDSAGRGEGIGSRYFTVLNGVADARPGALAAARAAASVVEALQTSGVTVWGRTGFNHDGTFLPITPDDNGVRHVQIEDLGRVELELGHVSGGHLSANGTLRDLPTGSSLDPASGRFAWTPSLGYLGAYRLEFVTGEERIPVDISIKPRPDAQTPDDGSHIEAVIDTPRSHDSVSGPITLAGWAIDPLSSIGSGIDAANVWARRRDVPAGSWRFLGPAALDGRRPDVARAFGPVFDRAGFSLTTDALTPGEYEVTIFFWGRRAARWVDSRTVTISVR